MRRFVVAHPYVGGSLMLHALLVALLLNLPGLGDVEQARAVATQQRQVDAQLAHTAERALQQRVARMEQILRLLSDAAGTAPPPVADSIDASPAALAARALALSEAIDATERKLRAAALARLARIPLAEASREVEARAAAEKPVAPASSPAETIERLERRAREALEVQRAQVQAQRNGVRVARAEAPTPPASASTGQVRPADGIPRSLAVQLAAEFRNGPPQGRVGEAGVEGGRSVNPKRVQGMAGGRIAHADDPGRVNPFGEGAPVKVPGSSLDLTGQGGPTGLDFVRPPKVDAGRVRTAAGRVFGPGGAFANRVYLDSWYLIGPFPGEGENPIDAVFPPEEGIDLDGSYRGLDGRIVGWRYASRGFYPFIPPDREERAIYYAYTELRIDEGRNVWLSIAADDDSMLWLDGRLVWASERQDKTWYRPPFYLPDEEVGSLALAEGHRRVHLGPGLHRLLFKLFNDRDRTFFSVVLAP